MIKLNLLLSAVSICGLCACSTAPKTEMEKAVASNIGEERIISRIDDMSSRPSWLKESQPFQIVDGKVLSLGMSVISINDNLSAAYRIAENNAKSSISHAVEQRLDYIFENAEEGTGFSSQARYIGSEASKLTSSNLQLKYRYWEKVAVQGQNEVAVQYRVFVLSQMDEPQFKAAITDAIRKSQGKQGISAEFAKKVDQHWDKFVNESSPNEQRTPSAKNGSEE